MLETVKLILFFFFLLSIYTAKIYHSITRVNLIKGQRFVQPRGGRLGKGEFLEEDFSSQSILTKN